MAIFFFFFIIWKKLRKRPDGLFGAAKVTCAKIFGTRQCRSCFVVSTAMNWRTKKGLILICLRSLIVSPYWNQQLQGRRNRRAKRNRVRFSCYASSVRPPIPVRLDRVESLSVNERAGEAFCCLAFVIQSTLDKRHRLPCVAVERPPVDRPAALGSSFPLLISLIFFSFYFRNFIGHYIWMYSYWRLRLFKGPLTSCRLRVARDVWQGVYTVIIALGSWPTLRRLAPDRPTGPNEKKTKKKRKKWKTGPRIARPSTASHRHEPGVPIDSLLLLQLFFVDRIFSGS